MPRITCPNCGTTINLENRKRTDFDLIVRATKKKPRTFTELLHITRLPRKTLSLRLKELCIQGSLIKGDHVYKLNGASTFENITIGTARGMSRVFQNGRTRTGFVLVMLFICFSTSGYVLAMFFPLPSIKEPSQEPVIIGNFAMDLNVNNVTDLYGWQVPIAYNQSELEVLKITQGEWNSFPYVLNRTDLKGELLLGGVLALGPVPGISGSGTLATVTFGYFTENYDLPQIALNSTFSIMMFNSQKSIIPLGDSTLTLSPVK